MTSKIVKVLQLQMDIFWNYLFGYKISDKPASRIVTMILNVLMTKAGYIYGIIFVHIILLLKVLGIVRIRGTLVSEGEFDSLLVRQSLRVRYRVYRSRIRRVIQQTIKRALEEEYRILKSWG